MTNKEAYEKIKAQFKKQGGTGYAGVLHWDGCACAVGALDLEAESGARYGIATRLVGDWYMLTRAHDLPLREALIADSPDLVDNAGYFRARIGTKTYRRVLRRIKKVLNV